MNIQGLIKTTLLDYPEHTACSIFTGGCNFCCTYCHNFEIVENRLPQISLDEIMSFLKNRKKILEGVVISGGEPCINKDLPEFIEKIKNIGYKIKLDTNGAYPIMLKELLDKNLLDYVAMDIKAPLCKEKLMPIINVDNIDMESLKMSVEILKNSSVDYEFRTTVTKEQLSIDDLCEISHMIKGCTHYIQPFKLSENVPNKTLSSYTKKELDEILKTLKNINPKTYIRG